MGKRKLPENHFVQLINDNKVRKKAGGPDPASDDPSPAPEALTSEADRKRQKKEKRALRRAAEAVAPVAAGRSGEEGDVGAQNKRKKRRKEAEAAVCGDGDAEARAARKLAKKEKKKAWKLESFDRGGSPGPGLAGGLAAFLERVSDSASASNPASSSANPVDDGDAPPPDTDSTAGALAAETTDRELLPLLPPTAQAQTVSGAPTPRRKLAEVERKLPLWITNCSRFAAIVHGAAKLAPLDSIALHPTLINELASSGVEGFFPVQSNIVPEVIRGHSHPMHPGDLCISAPTGSGKTLAYVLPILQCLHTRVIRRIRAVVVLPNRDLVGQVKAVFDQYAQCLPVVGADPQHRRLRSIALSGQTSFVKEQALLVSQRSDDGGSGIESLADIIIATPGRLVDHINNTGGLTLEHVQFLVVDEADRLLGQSYQEWLVTFLTAAHRESMPDSAASWSERRPPPGYTVRSGDSSIAANRSAQGSWLQKMLFSATLNHDPEQLAALNLAHPRLFIAQDGQAVTGESGHGNVGEDDMAEMTTPSTLTEHMVMCGGANKPLVLLHFLVTKGFQRTLIFTNSKEATQRLSVLLNGYHGVTCEEFSSSLSSVERRSIIERFKRNDLRVVVCSDAMARGMDLDGVENVVSYDPPVHARTYVHRIGRTARAGALGSAYTLLRRQEIRHFKQLRASVNSQVLPLIMLQAEDYAPFEDGYQKALENLAATVTAAPKTRATGHESELVAALSTRLAAKIRARKVAVGTGIV